MPNDPNDPGREAYWDPTKPTYGVRKKDILEWRPAQKRDIITDCVTLPIKFRSNTFRITVQVEVTDPDYQQTYSTARVQRVYSRDIDPVANQAGDRRVHGPYNGFFKMHGSRVITGVDPYHDWLGVK